MELCNGSIQDGRVDECIGGDHIKIGSEIAMDIQQVLLGKTNTSSMLMEESDMLAVLSKGVQFIVNKPSLSKTLV